VNDNVVPAEPGWVLIEATTGNRYPVVAWLPVDWIEKGDPAPQLWPWVLFKGRVPQVVSPQEMERANLRLEKEDGS
jgi:hypothetical protein